jgi:SAM-dependent methyltransferase
MHFDRIKWNRKFSAGSYPTRPSEIVTEFAGLAEKGRALDIAAGNGRHALYLADTGFTVEALDISDVGLRRFAGCHPNIRAACLDLEDYDLAEDRYNLILNIRYLNRKLMPQIAAALTSGGVLIFETYLQRPGFTPHRTICCDHLLGVNELLRSFPTLEIVFFRETFTPSRDEPYPLATLVAIRR